MLVNIKEKIWNEKFRPQVIDDCIIPEKIKQTFENFVIAQNCPNIMIYSQMGGTGKTTILKALCKQLDLEYLFINASEQRSIDILRNDITQFVSTTSLEGRQKAVLFDEFCLSEDEEIQIGLLENIKNKKLSELEKGVIYPIISLNFETMEKELDYGEIISDRVEEVYEVELEDGRKIVVTKEHPFFTLNENNDVVEKSIEQGLDENYYILTE